MKAVMVMFDSLNRHMLEPYGCDWTNTPNFRRLASRAVTLDGSYVCSMPCMPARRDLHTGRPNFLHCPWGPLQPFDDSVPQMLSDSGVYTHLASDHWHYWEDGGATYHNRYSSWEFFRGQEGDSWIGQVKDPEIPSNINPKSNRADWINRQHTVSDSQYSQSQTFESACRFLDRNHAEDNWFLQVECFDPHEPFTVHRSFRDLYPSDYTVPMFDWPSYKAVDDPPEVVEEARRNYAALLSKCDRSLGDILDAFDRYNLWEDTMLMLWTDHGFLLGEHNSWAKNYMPLYEQISHTPFFLWDPRSPDAAGERRGSLVQPAIDLGPTLLKFFGLESTESMIGKDLAGVIGEDSPVRNAAIFGYFDQHINVTDGRYVYLRAPDCDVPGADAYTLMPTTIGESSLLGGYESIENAQLSPPLSFTKGQPLLRIPRGNPDHYRGMFMSRKWLPQFPDPDHPAGHLLFDLEADPEQTTPLNDTTIAQTLIGHMVNLMRACDAPAEQYVRMAIPDSQA